MIIMSDETNQNNSCEMTVVWFCTGADSRKCDGSSFESSGAFQTGGVEDLQSFGSQLRVGVAVFSEHRTDRVDDEFRSKIAATTERRLVAQLQRAMLTHPLVTFRLKSKHLQHVMYFVV